MLAEIEYDGQLSASAYVILTAMVFLIVGGLSWCFYRAITAANKDAAEQLPDEE
jgi:hypothetical protein